MLNIYPLFGDMVVQNFQLQNSKGFGQKNCRFSKIVRNRFWWYGSIRLVNTIKMTCRFLKSAHICDPWVDFTEIFEKKIGKKIIGRLLTHRNYFALWGSISNGPIRVVTKFHRNMSKIAPPRAYWNFADFRKKIPIAPSSDVYSSVVYRPKLACDTAFDLYWPH